MDGANSASESFVPSFKASQPSAVSIALQTAVLSPTFLANLLGNISVCLVICGTRSLRQRPSSSILASLAMSDFSLLSFLLFRLIWLYDSEAASKACEHFTTLLITLLYVSIGHICLLGCDRYIAIIYPLRYAEIVTRTRLILALLVAWGAPLVSMVFLPLFYGDEAHSQLRTSVIGCSESTVEPHSLYKAHIALNGTMFVMIPFIVTIFVYGHIAKISWFHSSRVEPGENLNPETADLRRRKRKEMKWMKTTVVVIGSFTLCYLPGFICGALTVKLGPSRIPNALRSSGIVSMTINSALNPIIYMFRSNEFRIAFKKLFRGASIVPLPIESKKKARAPRSHLEVSTYNQHGRQHSFLTVSAEDAKALGRRMPGNP